MATKKQTRRPEGSGAVRQLPSGRWQARYPSPDGAMVTLKNGRQRPKLISAPQTFDTKLDAGAWLDRKPWLHPQAAEPEQEADPLFRDYSAAWLETRMTAKGEALRPTTRAHYRLLLDQHIVPTFGDLPLTAITSKAVRAWYVRTNADKPTLRAHSYALLKTILSSAVLEPGVALAVNPCTVKGGGQSETVKIIEPATLDELATISESMPAHQRLLVLLAAWCALRFGEVSALRRSDVDLERGVLRIRRGVVRVHGEVIIGRPKADSVRSVTIPPHLLPLVVDHLARYTGPGADALLFAARDGHPVAPSTIQGTFGRARQKAGRPDLRFHDLRHTGATLAAATGATLAELMARLGHRTQTAAMRYQHAAADRDRAIAEALSKIATGSAAGSDTR